MSGSLLQVGSAWDVIIPVTAVIGIGYLMMKGRKKPSFSFWRSEKKDKDHHAPAADAHPPAADAHGDHGHGHEPKGFIGVIFDLIKNALVFVIMWGIVVLLVLWIRNAAETHQPPINQNHPARGEAAGDPGVQCYGSTQADGRHFLVSGRGNRSVWIASPTNTAWVNHYVYGKGTSHEICDDTNTCYGPGQTVQKSKKYAFMNTGDVPLEIICYEGPSSGLPDRFVVK
jgi:hypothetical protein